MQSYHPKNKIRIVTAASLFDGHDAAINIMRRIMQASGAEIIHLGHNRSVREIVRAAIQEDAQAIAITSYQGGHMEYFKYMYDLLQEAHAGHIRIFGGGGGTILPEEIEALQAYGIAHIYSPDEGRHLGLQGMINDLLKACDFATGAIEKDAFSQLDTKHPQIVARVISAIENGIPGHQADLDALSGKAAGLKNTPVIGFTGTGGAGKSSLVDELIRRFLHQFPRKTIGVISVDPTKRKTGGALLGDRIRMNAIDTDRVYLRSLATRQANQALSQFVQPAIDVLKVAGFDLIILESSGIGQSGSEITDHVNLAVYVMTPEYGAASQLEKIDMLDFADVVVINKFDKRGAQDALRDVRKQYVRNHQLWDQDPVNLPVFGTMASQFNDPGVNVLYHHLLDQLGERGFLTTGNNPSQPEAEQTKRYIIPPARTRYLAEIAENNRQYDGLVKEQADLAREAFALSLTLKRQDSDPVRKNLQEQFEAIWAKLDATSKEIIENWKQQRQAYQDDTFTYLVRGKAITVPTRTETLSHQLIPKIAFPRWEDWGEQVHWSRQENVPGSFPYTAGVFPFKRKGEDPTRMFAGEGSPERTNRRFHYLSYNMPAIRLSTAFDSVTLYGEDPDHRPDIYGKVGNSGVSICSLDDIKRLYSGFDLCDPKTSVSMTINGPAATMTALFMNAAIDQQCEKYIIANGLEAQVEQFKKQQYDERGLSRPEYRTELPPHHDQLGLLLLGLTGDQVLSQEIYQECKDRALASVRGTVQADILKEDQAQNTCIFSTEFSLQLMGDMQAYFIDQQVRNFYSVSISGYHIAEAGANPITQLAFTLSNGFTYVEYYLSRGMHIDDFAPNFSFFFSNGLDPEYAVIGRVARRIWAKAIKHKYGGNERSQMLKYHIQTSGRSLHAQEIAFNDIRTTLQALYAIYDNCNSLHTNAYDEAITTPTEESVRRAVAIQLIINHELGMTRNENPLQGAFIIEELTDLVEEAVLLEFERISDRGGVLGAMETMYQRSRIQEESLYYETLKHSGAYPIIGVNTFLSKEGSPTIVPREVIRATGEEKQYQISSLHEMQSLLRPKAQESLKQLRQKALEGENLFETLMETVKYCSLGQITHALYEVGGQYRRNM
ncbi:MAG: methylmalonyl-CoA mutase family protein [Saprospiraceae bacterium]|nr:methylmalonyl-CoA mutase family protein [Saprospiraceae bacterium]MCB9321819.1 methylmalonyl-CoA mutase family protein [Lewinellaceae bacterium]